MTTRALITLLTENIYKYYELFNKMSRKQIRVIKNNARLHKKTQSHNRVNLDILIFNISIYNDLRCL